MKMVINEMEKNLTKYISCMLLILMIFSMISPTNILVLAAEDKEHEESQAIDDLDENLDNLEEPKSVNTSFMFNDDANLETYTMELNDVEELIGWQKENEQWYYYDSDIALTGWQTIENNRYFFDSNGIMQTGWLQQESQWYYFKSSGEMVTNWAKVGNTWYFFNNKGIMQTGWLQQGSQWYYLKSSGAMATNWAKVGNTWYYFKSNGVMQTGWLQQGNQWYYLKSSGAMVMNWAKVGNTWYYFKSNGVMQTGWLQQGNQWYYLKSSGAMATNWAKIGNTWYYFKSNGVMQTGWLKQGNTWYYLKSSGAMAVGWEKIGNEWYNFNKNGAMQNDWRYENKFEYKNNTLYVYNSNGSLNKSRYVGQDHALVSISNQYLWVFRNGKLSLSVPVITGSPYTPTPTGNFWASNKFSNIVLTGPTWSYHVDYWIEFHGNGMYGIHDAYWQSNSNFYLNSGSNYNYGSHGCVNVKVSDMASVYNEIWSGMPVTIVP